MGGTCDLGVDTGLIRRAATLLRQAADTTPGRPRITAPPEIAEHAAGASAQGRQALRLVLTRTEQAIEAAGTLGSIAAQLADRLARAAALFDEAEARCHAGTG